MHYQQYIFSIFSISKGRYYFIIYRTMDETARAYV